MRWAPSFNLLMSENPLQANEDNLISQRVTTRSASKNLQNNNQLPEKQLELSSTEKKAAITKGRKFSSNKTLTKMISAEFSKLFVLR